MRFTVNIDPEKKGKKPSFDIEAFFMTDKSRIESEEGYGFKLSWPFCLECGGNLKQTFARSDGTGGLACQCSYWSSEISTFSGASQRTQKLKKDRAMTTEEKAKVILWSITHDPDNLHRERKEFTPEIRKALKELL